MAKITTDNGNKVARKVLTTAEATGLLQAYKVARGEYQAAKKAFEANKPGMTDAQIDEAKKGVTVKEIAMEKATDAINACAPTVKDKPAALALFQAYAKAADQITAAKAAIESARVVASDATEAILLGLGKGPFTYNGKVYSVTRRGELYFMKSPGSNDITDIG
jgi:hypothetical protein